MTAPAPIRVLVVEDSSTVRKVVSDALTSDREITVVGTAANGRIGLTELARLDPDLVTLDIEMPEMDGLTMLTELRKTHPRVPVIMVSTLTGRGASATLDALARGASDYVTKPSSATATTATSAIEHFRRELIPRVKALCPRRATATPAARAAAPAAPAAPRRPLTGTSRPGTAGTLGAAAGADGALRLAAPSNRGGRIELLAIGCSTGGPNALEVVMRDLPGDLSVPVLVTQHMPPIFTKMLAERLDQKSRLHVMEAEDGMEVQPGKVYLAPGDYHMVLKRVTGGFVVATHQGPPENSCRPAVDVMFRSIAESFGGRALAVVMTGMGYDGRVGCGAIAAAGGDIIVQDQATSVVWGMPGAVAEAGLANEILPLDQLASAITSRITKRPVPLQPRTAAAPAAPALTPTTPRPLAAARTAVAPGAGSTRPGSSLLAPARRPVPAPAPRPGALR